MTEIPTREDDPATIGRFAAIFAAEGERMKSVAWPFLRNEADCEDAVQDAFLKVYRGVERFEGKSSLSTWIYRILVNACLDLRRKRVRRAQTYVAEELGEGAGRAAAHPLRVGLEQAMDALGETERAVFVLYEVEGFRHREIADILGIPEGTSKNTLFRAKRELREALLARNREMTR